MDTNATNDGCYIGLRRQQQENTMNTTNEQLNGPRNLQLENTLDVVDSLIHLVYSTDTFQAIQAEEPVLWISGDTLFEQRQYSEDLVDLEARALGSYLLIQAVIKTPGALDAMMKVLRTRVVAHLRPDLLRVFDDAQAPPA